MRDTDDVNELLGTARQSDECLTDSDLNKSELKVEKKKTFFAQKKAYMVTCEKMGAKTNLWVYVVVECILLCCLRYFVNLKGANSCFW